MGGADPRRAYAILTQWYQNAFVQAPNPSQTDMEKVRGDLQNLYHREEPHPPVLPPATHVYPSKMNYKVPLEAEVEAAVRRLRPHRSGRHAHLRAGHIKQWRRESYPWKQLKTPRGGSAGCVC